MSAKTLPDKRPGPDFFVRGKDKARRKDRGGL